MSVQVPPTSATLPGLTRSWCVSTLGGQKLLEKPSLAGRRGRELRLGPPSPRPRLQAGRLCARVCECACVQARMHACDHVRGRGWGHSCATSPREAGAVTDGSGLKAGLPEGGGQHGSGTEIGVVRSILSDTRVDSGHVSRPQAHSHADTSRPRPPPAGRSACACTPRGRPCPLPPDHAAGFSIKSAALSHTSLACLRARRASTGTHGGAQCREARMCAHTHSCTHAHTHTCTHAHPPTKQ